MVPSISGSSGLTLGTVGQLGSEISNISKRAGKRVRMEGFIATILLGTLRLAQVLPPGSDENRICRDVHG